MSRIPFEESTTENLTPIYNHLMLFRNHPISIYVLLLSVRRPLKPYGNPQLIQGAF